MVIFHSYVSLPEGKNTSSNLPEFRIPSSLQHGHRTQQGQGFMPLSGAAGFDHRAVMLNLWTRWKIVPSRLLNETSEMMNDGNPEERWKSKISLAFACSIFLGGY